MPAPEGDTTGRTRFRRTLFGRLVLEVERERWIDGSVAGKRLYWASANEHDLFRLRFLNANPIADEAAA